MTSSHFTGRCNCDAFQFNVPPSPEYIGICFCKNCVRNGGFLCVICSVVAPDAISFTKGSKEELKLYLEAKTYSGNPMEKWFCPTCASVILVISQEAPDTWYFKYNTLDDVEGYAAGRKPTEVIFAGQAPSWLRSTGGALTFPQGKTQYAEGVE